MTTLLLSLFCCKRQRQRSRCLCSGKMKVAYACLEDEDSFPCTMRCGSGVKYRCLSNISHHLNWRILDDVTKHCQGLSFEFILLSSAALVQQPSQHSNHGQDKPGANCLEEIDLLSSLLGFIVERLLTGFTENDAVDFCQTYRLSTSSYQPLSASAFGNLTIVRGILALLRVANIIPYLKVNKITA